MASVSLTSCVLAQTPVPKVSEIAGSWHHSSTTQGSPTITFHTDMTVSVSDVPKSVVLDDVNNAGKFAPGHPISLSGVWTVGAPSGTKRDADGDPFIDISFGSNRYTTGMNFLVVGSGTNIQLIVEGGDPDSYVTYKFVRS
jgi:hypothetical protein